MRLTAGNSAETSEGLRGYHDYTHCFGDELRGRRASMGKGLLDVQKDIGIRPWLIAAIENADAESFDSPWLIAPYVKSYARYLGIGPEEAYARFQAECNSEAGPPSENGRLRRLRAPNRAMHATPASGESSGMLSDLGFSRAPDSGRKFALSKTTVASIAVAAALCASVVFMIWTVYTDVQQLPEEPVSAYSDSMVNSKPPITSVTESIVDRSRLAPPDFSSSPKAIGELDPATVGVYGLPGDPSAASAEFADSFGSDKNEPLAGPGVQAEFKVASNIPPNIAIVASALVWIRIYNHKGVIAEEGFLEAGEAYTVPSEGGPYTLRTGLSTNTYFRIGNQIYGPVPEDGDTVVDNIVLTREAIVENFPEIGIEEVNIPKDVSRYVFSGQSDESF